MQTVDCSDSSNLAEVAYDELSGELTVTFKNGSKYAYEDVSQDHWMGFQGATSRGAFLANHIKPNYACRRIA